MLVFNLVFVTLDIGSNQSNADFKVDLEVKVGDIGSNQWNIDFKVDLGVKVDEPTAKPTSK